MPDPQKLFTSIFDGINPTTANKFIKFTLDAITQHNPTELYYLFLLLEAMLILDSRSTIF